MTTLTDSSMPDSRRSSFVLFLLMALLVLGIGLGLRDPWPPDEPALALAAKQLLQSGDWLFPQRGRELYTADLPLSVWMQAWSYKFTGSWRAAFLLPSLLSGLLTLALTYSLGRRFWNRRVGLYAAVGLLFSYQFTFEFKHGHVDAIATGLITLANWGLLVHLLRGPNWRAFWIGCFAAGIGFLATSSAVLVALMFVPYFVARWRHWDGVTVTENALVKWLIGAAAFALPILIWMIAVSSAAKSHAAPAYASYLHDALFRHDPGSGEPFWLVFPLILFGWMPFSLIYVAAGPGWFHDVRSGDVRVIAPLLWAAMFIVIMAIASTRSDVSLLPALPMLAVAIAPQLPAFASDRWARYFGFFLALIGGLLFIGVGGFSLLSHNPATERFIQEHGLTALDWIVWVMIVAMGCAMLISALVFRPRRGVSALLGALAGLWLIWSIWAYPMLNDSSSAAAVMRRARDLAGKDNEISLVAWKEQNLLMATGPVRDFGFLWPWNLQYQEALDWQAKDPLKRFVFILDDALGNCIDKNKATRVGHVNHHDWWMFKGDAVVAGCTPNIPAGE